MEDSKHFLFFYCLRLVDTDGILARIGFKEFPDINAITGAMKLYLRELPIPLVPFKMYTAFMTATSE